MSSAICPFLALCSAALQGGIFLFTLSGGPARWVGARNLFLPTRFVCGESAFLLFFCHPDRSGGTLTCLLPHHAQWTIVICTRTDFDLSFRAESSKRGICFSLSPCFSLLWPFSPFFGRVPLDPTTEAQKARKGTGFDRVKRSLNFII